MAASRTRVLTRVTTLLNLAEAGTYSSILSTRNKTRNANEIVDFVDEAGLKICEAMAERPNEFRYQFLANSTVTTSGDQMPVHLGPPASVKITLYEDGPVRDGKPMDYRKIVSYRENPQQVYDEVDHDEALEDTNGDAIRPSTLSGYFAIWDDKFYFTGYSAVLSLARLPVRADNLTLIPEIMENTWVRLAVGEAAKVGVGGYESAIIGEYAKRGMMDLEEFKTGKRMFQEVDDPAPSSAVHTVR